MSAETAMGTRHTSPMTQSNANMTATNATGVTSDPTKSGSLCASTSSVWPAQPSTTRLRCPEAWESK